MPERDWLRMWAPERLHSVDWETALSRQSRAQVDSLLSTLGFGVSVCGIIGYRGLQLGTFDTITGLNPYKKDPGFLGAVTTFGAAQTAITIGAGATYPFDTVRRRLQMQSEKPVEEHIYKGTVDCFKKIAAEEGRGLTVFHAVTKLWLSSILEYLISGRQFQ